MKIRSLDPESRADIDSWLTVQDAALSVDAPDLPPPCRDDLVGGLRVPWPGERDRRWLAEADGRVVGGLRLGFSELDNRDNAELEIVVHPRARRQGIGTRLHDLATVEAQREGRRRLMSDSIRALDGRDDRPGAGSRFCRGTGATLGQTEIRRRLDVSAVDGAGLARRVDELARGAGGYSLVSWAGAAPDDLAGGVAALDSSFLAEAPLGTLAWEPQNVDVARVRQIERSRRARGAREYHTVARHDATGELVGWTMLVDPHCPAWYAEQEVTLVAPAHRGHRLGLLVKLANLAQAIDASPDLTVVDTTNAEENTHMIAVNQAMGFRAVDAWDAWQLNL